MATHSGYINGSNILLQVDGYTVGHCTTHSIKYTSETKERKVKPVASVGVSSGLWTSVGVVGLSITATAEGINYYGETGTARSLLLKAWATGGDVYIVAYERENASTPYLKGSFVITNFEETHPAQDDSTFSVEFQNDGEPDLFSPSNMESNGTEGTEEQESTNDE